MRTASLRSAVIFASVLGFTSVGRAADIAGADLRVTRAPGVEDCPDDVALAQSVAALGARPRAPGPSNDTAPWIVEVSFERAGDEYAATIRSSGRKPGVRTLTVRGPGCANLAEATRVALAVLLDLVAEPPAVAEPSPASRAPTPAPPPPATAANPAPSAPILAIGIQSGAAYGLLGDAASAIVGAGLLLGGPRWDVTLSGHWLPSRDVDFAPGSVEVGLTLFRLEGCLSAERRERSGPGACVILGGGLLAGDGEGFDADYRVTKPWFAGGAGFFYRLGLSDRAVLRLGLSLLVPLHHQVFSVRGAGQAFETPLAAGILELGPQLTIW